MRQVPLRSSPQGKAGSCERSDRIAEESIAYVYCSKDYLGQIETVYNGPSSKNNSGFTAGKYADKLDYSDQLAAERLVKTLKTDSYTKTHIDENCIVGWAKYIA